MYEIKCITDTDFTDVYWKKYFDLLSQLKEKYNSSLIQKSWEKLKNEFLAFTKIQKHLHRILVLKNSNPIGWMHFNVRNYKSENRQYSCKFDVLYNEIPVDVGLMFAGILLEYSQKYGCNIISCVTDNQRVSNMIRSWKCRELNIIVKYQLKRKDANLGLINKWLNSIPDMNKNENLIFDYTIPDKYLGQFESLYAQCLNDMPKERDRSKQFNVDAKELQHIYKWNLKNNRPTYGYLLVNENDDLVGFSQTFIDADNPIDVYQGMTGIKQEYRGRGLSKWLKASLFKKVEEDFPENEIITSEMQAVNIPIMKVNAQMGYKKISEGNEFEISLEALQNYISIQLQKPI